MDQSTILCGAVDGSPAVKICSVTEENGVVTVTGTAANVGLRSIEVIVNGDLDLRYVAKWVDNVVWNCRFSLPHCGEYQIEASVRDYSDFAQIRQITPNENYFSLEDANVWGATVTRHTDGLYYMVFSTWDTHEEFKTDWYQYSELGLAVSTRLQGPYVYRGKVLDASYAQTTNQRPVVWAPGEINVFHNPSFMYSERDGKYYLYFMGTTTKGEMPASHLQRVGVAYADHPAGPYTVAEQPVINVREQWEWSIVANPSVMEMKNSDGGYCYYAVYKGSGTYEGQRLKATGYATAPTPLGPFLQSDAPIMRDAEIGFSVEDCYVWHHNGVYYALAKDMTKGHFTGVFGGYSYALFESANGQDWALSPHNLAFKNEILWQKGVQGVSHLERAQLYVQDGVPMMMCNATTEDGTSPYRGAKPYNVQTPLLGVPLARDRYILTVTDLPEKQIDKETLIGLAARAKKALTLACTREQRQRLCSALRAAEIVCKRENAVQQDIDFVAQCLAELLEH